MSNNQDSDTSPLHLSTHAQKNREMWEATSDSYEQLHATALGGEKAMSWGLWRIPEAELHVLGEVAGNEWARHWPMENIWKLRKEK